MIYENYKKTEVAWPQKSPFSFNSNGGIRLNDGNARDMGSGGNYWSSTNLSMIDRSHFLYFYPGILYPTTGNLRSLGFSVHKISIILFTPYGYKFEGKREDGYIYGNYMTDEVQKPYLSPWKFTNAGRMPNSMNINDSVGMTSWYWTGTTLADDYNPVYDFWLDTWAVRPSNYNGRSHGYSVH